MCRPRRAEAADVDTEVPAFAKQALSHFVTNSPWMSRRLAARMDEAIGPQALAVDDIGWLKPQSGAEGLPIAGKKRPTLLRSVGMSAGMLRGSLNVGAGRAKPVPIVTGIEVRCRPRWQPQSMGISPVAPDGV